MLFPSGTEPNRAIKQNRRRGLKDRSLKGCALKSRHCEDAALSAVGIDKGCIYGRRICGGGNTVQADVVERLTLDCDKPLRNDRAVLLHANDRVIALVGDSELLTPVYWPVSAWELLTLLSQYGLFALNICTAPPSVDSWSPLLSWITRN